MVAGGFKAASKDPEQISAWWREFPHALIGVPTGAASGIFAVDLDGVAHGGPDGLVAWDELTAGHAAPPTLRHETPNGGVHLLYRYDPQRPVTNRRGALPAGVDVRGDGGYIIWPPSKLPDGRSWRVPETCETDAVSDAPEWLYELIVEKPAAPPSSGKGNGAYADAALADELAAVSGARRGRRNATLNKAAFSLGQFVGAQALSAPDVEARLYGAAQASGLVADDGERAVMATLRSGLGAGQRSPRDIPAPNHNGPHKPRRRSEPWSASPSPGEDVSLPPPPELEDLTAEAWKTKKLPRRDYLMGTALCTTSRWMIIGDTGVGKTLLGIAIAMAIAANQQILNWKPCGRPRVTMYIDGELPAETFQERVRLPEALYGAAGVQFYGYNLEELEQKGQGFEPFNTQAGRAWLEREIGRLKPDLIVFDSVMCLTVDAMGDDRAWRPVAELMSWITSKRVAQIWIHHTGHDPTRGFGTKSREWRLDTVVTLIDADNDGLTAEEGAPVEMRFKKARLRTPQNRSEFQDFKIACGPSGWRIVGEPLGDKPATRGKTDKTILIRAFCDAYDRLADGVEVRGEDRQRLQDLQSRHR